MTAGASCDDGHCVTCSDEGIAMRVVGRAPDGSAVCVDAAGASTAVLTDLVDPVAVDDVVLVHAGVALARLEPAA